MGPLLFLIYINNLPSISKFCTLLFADDACLIMSDSTLSKLQTKTNTELNKISNWLSYNKLCLNYQKTVFLTFNRHKTDYKLNLNIDNKTISEVHQTEYLGVTFDNKLSWLPHILNVRSKISKGCWALSCMKKYANQKTLRLIYFALIYPHLHYGILCWGSAYQTHLQKLLTKQKWTVKIITNSNRLSPSTPLFHDLKILKLNEIFKYKIGMEVKSLINNNSLNSFGLSYVHSIHSHSTRSSTNNNLSSPQVKTNIGKSLFKFQAPLAWNKIPHELRNGTMSFFKSNYKKHLLKNYSDSL